MTVIETHEGRVEVAAADGAGWRAVHVATDDARLRVTGEALVAMQLLPAMRRGTPLHIERPVGARLRRALPTLQHINAAWYPTLAPIDVETAERSAADSAPAPGRGVGMFFSGGLDSFYTLLRHRDEITHLVFIHPFDRVPEVPALLADKIAAVRRVGRHFDKHVVVVETDLRAYLERHVAWKKPGYGAALFTVGHLLAGELSRLYIAAGATYADWFATATHPLVDPLWSSEHLAFVHDGREADRVEKAALVAESDLALETLRVCFRNHGGDYNCGVCEKCVRTMLNLEAVGGLERCTTFAVPLDPANVRRVVCRSDGPRATMRANLAALEGRGADPQLLAAVRRSLRRSSVEGMRGRWNETRERMARRLLELRRAARGPLWRVPGLHALWQFLRRPFAR